MFATAVNGIEWSSEKAFLTVLIALLSVSNTDIENTFMICKMGRLMSWENFLNKYK